MKIPVFFYLILKQIETSFLMGNLLKGLEVLSMYTFKEIEYYWMNEKNVTK